MLFSENCKEIIIRKESNLKEIIEFIINGFAPTMNNDKTIHENFSLYIFLIALHKISKLKFPIKVINREHPDFFIKIGKNEDIGLEHTIATIEQYKIALSEFKKYPQGSFIQPTFYSPTKKLPQKKSDIGIKKPGEEVTGPGYTGFQIENEWAIIMLKAIQDKTYLLNYEHFKKYETNELIIQDHTPVSGFQFLDKSIEMLKKLYFQTTFNKSQEFDKIHIFSGNNLIYDVFGKIEIVDISKSELKKINL